MEQARKPAPASKKKPPRGPRVHPALQTVPDWVATLQPDEKILRIATIHSGIYWKGITMFLLSIFLLITLFNLGVFIMFVSLVMLVLAYLTRSYLLLVLTDKRVLVRRGIIQLDTVQIHHVKIESVEVIRSPMGRFLGYATVLVTGTGSRVTAVPFIGDADVFRTELDALILAREEVQAVTVVPAPPPVGAV